MTLNFFGRGAGFSNDHTSAYFSTDENELVVIDCSISTFQKLKKLNLSNYEKIYILITHTHGDHISGLGLTAQYAFFTLKKLVTIVAPSLTVASDISTVLNIEGNEASWYKLITAFDLKGKSWYIDCIRTKHSPQLDNKCFGYIFNVNGVKIIYTSDTSTLKPFIPYFEYGAELYVDTSVYYGMIHLKLEDILEELKTCTQRGMKVFLMHLDDVRAAKEIIKDIPDIEIITVSTDFPKLTLDIDKYAVDVNQLVNDYFDDYTFIELLQKSNNLDVILSIANDISTNSKVLAKLANLYEWSIRLAVAKNLNSSKETLAILSKDEFSFIRLAVAQNLSTGFETISALKEDTSAEVRFAAIEAIKNNC